MGFRPFEPGNHVLDPRADVHEPASHVAVAALDRCFLDRLCATGQDQFGVPAGAFGRDDANRRTLIFWALSQARFARQRGSIAIRNKATSAASQPRPCATVGGGHGRAPGLAVSICSVSAVISICCVDSSASVAFVVLFGRRVRVSSKCRRLIWPKAIRLNG
jgi:hypothetical protein